LIIIALITLTTKFWSESLKGIYFLGEVGIYAKIILQFILKKYCKSKRNAFIRLRIRTSGGLL
jgi:hypothetical protein